MRILAIETSCDETALAIVEAGGTSSAPRIRVFKNIVSSQIALHTQYGGVVPNLAKREHLKNLPIILKKIAGTNNKNLRGIDQIAVTAGPGLEPALWAGITFAQELARKITKPLVGANHMEGHLYSFLLNRKNLQTLKYIFPCIAIIVSGGHTILLRMDSLVRWKKLGETRDDAVGEAFDKVARMLHLPYPGGPQIELLAKRGNPTAVPFPRPMLKDKNYDFSFSGLKTAVLYYLRDNPTAKTADVAASFQWAAVDVLVQKTMRAAAEYNAKSVILAGGVAANALLRKTLGATVRKNGLVFFAPPQKFNTDNAAMIAAAAFMATFRHKKYPLEANGTMSI